MVRGRTVIDLGTGSGLVAIAAARAGAARVIAVDRDPVAIEMLQLNACLNDVFIEAEVAEIDGPADRSTDVVLAGDLWYERFDGARASRILRASASKGATVLVGDPTRAFFPRSGIEVLAQYDLKASSDLETADRVETVVCRLLPHAAKT